MGILLLLELFSPAYKTIIDLFIGCPLAHPTLPEVTSPYL